MKGIKMRTIVGLIILYSAIYYNLDWIWSILFLIWVIPDLFTGITYFIDPIDRKVNPVLYWIIVTTWLALSIYPVLGWLVPGWEFHSSHRTAVSVGTYSNKIKSETINVLDTKLLGGYGLPLSTEKGREQSAKLEYKTFEQNNVTHFVGVSETLTWEHPQLEEKLDQVVQRFYNDLSIHTDKNLMLDKVFVLYSDFSNQEEGEFKLTVGYQTNVEHYAKKGYESLSVATNAYAVFEHNTSDYENWVKRIWNEIAHSDLKIANGTAMEVYVLNDAYDVSEVEVRIPIQ